VYLLAIVKNNKRCTIRVLCRTDMIFRSYHKFFSQASYVCLLCHNVEYMSPSRSNCKPRIMESVNLKQFRILDDFAVFTKGKQLVVF
jgi:hypothetical protein